MKPNFALSLSAESIRLLHRVTGGWRIVGEVSPQAQDLTTELAALRRTGTALAPDGLRCKVVIPNEQIRYLTVETPGLDLSEARDAARQALSKATPYPVDDLAYDVVQVGETTQVAAVALETLREAEHFATTHRFHPVSFVACPDDNPFAAEPYFGPAQAARAVLEPGQTVDPDAAAIVILDDIEEAAEPVADVTTDIPVVDVPETASPDPVEPELPAFRSARGTVEAEDVLSDALASLRSEEATPAGVTDPSLPPRDVDIVKPSFASRRTSAPPVYDTGAEQAATVGGFAEPAEPFVPKPRAPAKPRAARPPVPAAPPVTTKVSSEAERMTVFGARNAERPHPATAWRVPLALTGVLVLALVAIGTWSAGSLRDTVAGWTGGSAPDVPEPTAIEVAPPIDPTASTPAQRQPELASLQPGLSDEDAAVLDALRTPLAADEAAAPAPNLDELRANYAVTGIWPLAPTVPSPPPLVDIEDLYVTSIDPIEPAFDAVALPDVATFDRDTLFDAPVSPAAAGTTFALDSRGLVVASADGTVNPDGIRIFAGAPPARPAAFPSRSSGERVELSPVQTELAAFRPRARPADLVENTERAVLDGLTRDELAELRPPVRPVPPASGAPAAGASLVPLDDAEPETIEASNSRLALAASLRPDARPSNFSQIVARAQQTAASAAAVGTASIAAPAPRAAVAPQIPSSASVAREATLRNAINLRKVNLIGVYGTPSSRRALVRLSNGRYKKVQVGDRIDGGRVSAIGEGELRYEKRGRNIVLKMPRG
ncbi:hypothetical protein [Roseobacter sinensis]|uniref:Type IV pilus biogenesis n=1 Tax=Roseobacter sinensis TaxID=2931391 RepID=A0ABT3BGE2_9RHOB|nr:hypothetical protein [Roseobacter sp. WL0113]MCV3272651.1 hypothetical protein [Roseobacter sp. WL0113]